jgi:NAD(P)-dependent dehydrogenase (short-subunit alcohol dehydrogenase family)
MMPNEGRVALITGCGKPIGIGASTARALAEAGITVVVTDIAASGLANEHNMRGDVDPSWRGVDSLVEQIEVAGGQASSAIGDVSQENDARRLVETVLSRYGRLDILVNNAGAPQGADRNEIEDVPVEAWDQTMAVNARVESRDRWLHEIFGAGSGAAWDHRERRAAWPNSNHTGDQHEPARVRRGSGARFRGAVESNTRGPFRDTR